MKRLLDNEEVVVAGPDFLCDVLPSEILNEVVARVNHPGALVRLELVTKAIGVVAKKHWTNVALAIVNALGEIGETKGLDWPVRLLCDAYLERKEGAVIPDAKKLVVPMLALVVEKMVNTVEIAMNSYCRCRVKLGDDWDNHELEFKMPNGKSVMTISLREDSGLHLHAPVTSVLFSIPLLDELYLKTRNLLTLEAPRSRTAPGFEALAQLLTAILHDVTPLVFLEMKMNHAIPRADAIVLVGIMDFRHFTFPGFQDQGVHDLKHMYFHVD